MPCTVVNAAGLQLGPARPCPNTAQRAVPRPLHAARPARPARHVVRAAAAAVADVRLPRWEDIHRPACWLPLTALLRHTEVGSGLRQVLVDVRPAADYDKAHPEGAVNVQLFQRTNFAKPSFASYLRAAALMANGVTPIEQNPDFVTELAAAGGGGAPGVILACEAGGVLDPSSSFPFGKESRSLKAAFKAVRSGQVKEVLHLQGGVYGWFRAELPFVGEYSTENLGRTPNAVGVK